MEAYIKLLASLNLCGLVIARLHAQEDLETSDSYESATRYRKDCDLIDAIGRYRFGVEYENAFLK